MENISLGDFEKIIKDNFDEDVKYIIGVDTVDMSVEGSLTSVSIYRPLADGVRVEYLKPHEVIAKYRGQLTEKQIKILENYGK